MLVEWKQNTTLTSLDIAMVQVLTIMALISPQPVIYIEWETRP